MHNLLFFNNEIFFSLLDFILTTTHTRGVRCAHPTPLFHLLGTEITSQEEKCFYCQPKEGLRSFHSAGLDYTA